MHKTGSSSIQNVFRHYDEDRTKYAELGFENHSIPFYTAFSEDYLNYHIWANLGLSKSEIINKKKECIKKIEEVLTNNKSDNLIFSGEDISLLQQAEVKILHELLSKHCEHISVYAYLRSPQGFITSNFQERVKAGLTENLFIPPEYEKKLNSFISIFGENNVHFRMFDRKALINNDIIDDFSQWVSTPSPQKQKNKTNESISTEAVKYIYLLNKSNPLTTGEVGLIKAREDLVKTLRTIFPGAFKLPDNLILPYIDNDDIDWIHKKSNIAFDETDLDWNMNENQLNNNELDLFLTSISHDSALILRGYLQSIGIKNDFDLSPVKLINKLYYVCLIRNQNINEVKDSLAHKIKRKKENILNSILRKL